MNTYSFFEKKCASPHRRRCIDKTVTGSNKCVGYCQYGGHPGFLTEELRKAHDCIRKGCLYYVEKEKQRQIKWSCVGDSAKALLKIAAEKTENYEGMRIMRAQQKDKCKWVLKYITISSTYPFESIAKTIAEATGYQIILEKLHYGFDVCAKILLEGA